MSQTSRSSSIPHYLRDRENGQAARSPCARAREAFRYVVPNASALVDAPEATNVHFSPDGRWLVSVNATGSSISLWDVGCPRMPGKALAVGAPQGRRLLTNECQRTQASTSASEARPATAFPLPLHCARADRIGHGVSFASPRATRSEAGMPSAGVATRRGSPPHHILTSCARPCNAPGAAAAPASIATLAEQTSVFSGQGSARVAPCNGPACMQPGSLLATDVPSLATFPTTDDSLATPFGKPPSCSWRSVQAQEPLRGECAWRHAQSAACASAVAGPTKKRTSEQAAIIDEWERTRRLKRRHLIFQVRAGPSRTLAGPSSRAQYSGTARSWRLNPPFTVAPPPAPVQPLAPAPSQSEPATMSALFQRRYTAHLAAPGEVLSSDVCLFTSDVRHMIFASCTLDGDAEPSGAPRHSTVHLVRLSDGTVVDRLRFPNEQLVSRSKRSAASWSLHGDLLALLLSDAQEVALYHCTGKGFLLNCSLGSFLRSDDHLMLQEHDARSPDLPSSPSQASSAHIASPRILSPRGVRSPRSTSRGTRSPVPLSPVSNASDAARSRRTPSNDLAQIASSSAMSAGATAGTYDSAASGAPPITGLRHCVIAFVFRLALAGRDITASQRLDATFKDALAAARAAPSVAAALENDAPLPKGGSITASPSARAALMSFHRLRSSLEDLKVEAVHLLSDSKLVMVMGTDRRKLLQLLVGYDFVQQRTFAVHALNSAVCLACISWFSTELQQLHAVCPFQTHLSLSHFAREHLDALVSAASAVQRVPSTAQMPASARVSANYPAPVVHMRRGHSGHLRESSPQPALTRPGSTHLAPHASTSALPLRDLSPQPNLSRRGSAHLPSGLSEVSSQTALANSYARKSLHATLESLCAAASLHDDPSASSNNTASVAYAASQLPTDRLKHFLLVHLPGSSQGILSSPYFDPAVFAVERGGRQAQLHTTKWQRALPGEPSYLFSPARDSTRHQARASFSITSASEAGLEESLFQNARSKVSVSHKFHPFLPLAISCYHPSSSLVVHFRQ